MKFIKTMLFCYLFFSLIITHYASAENPLIDEGIALYRQEDYDEALEVLKKAREQEGESTLAAYYLGLTYKQIEDYEGALPHLQDAVTYQPKIKGALLELIEVFYQLGRLEEAQEYIVIAEQEGIRPAQTSYLKGLVLLKQGKNIRAIEAFREAKSLDESLRQTADYQIGMALIKEKKFGEAKNAFREVITLDPNANAALFAHRYMEAISKKEETERPLKFSLRSSYEYDNNVILLPSDAAATSVVADESDTRQVLSFGGEYTHRITDQFRLKLGHSIYLANQDDLDEYDVFSNTTTLTPSYYLQKSSLNCPVSYNYTMVGGHSYLSTLSVTPMLNYMLGRSLMAQLYFKYQNKNFMQSSVNVNEKRDADSYLGGTGLYWFFADNKGFLNVRYELNKDDAEGRNWEYSGNKFAGTLLIPLTDKLKVSGSADVFFQDFENIHTVFGNEREDDVYTLSCMAGYEIFENAEAQLRYTYVTTDSNIAVYEYDRHIVGAGVQYEF
ncbi:MAG: tetratricopeptide repeat protein [Candidatus Omnitrophica bacterium]|nr:tetratricopeptide repeat protein [Candidatus Omnitrophota bacterium]